MLQTWDRGRNLKGMKRERGEDRDSARLAEAKGVSLEPWQALASLCRGGRGSPELC